MARTRDFSGLGLRDIVAIEVGPDVYGTSLSGVVITAGKDCIEIALAGQPQERELLAPGAMVRVRRGNEASIRAQVISYARGPRPSIIVRPLATAEVARNHRTAPRVPVHRPPVTLVARTADRSVGFQGWMLDLSGGGARLAVSVPLQVGDELILRLPLPDETERTPLRAVVAWHQRAGDTHQLGIRFLDMPAALRDRLAHAVFRAELALRKPAG